MIRAGYGPWSTRVAGPVRIARLPRPLPGIAAGYRDMSAHLQPRAHHFPHPRRGNATIPRLVDHTATPARKEN
ncbi:hypothetical protein RAA17_02350 [Komagataeibacter rhaeticus]|nr:hypothetical protein [Komagataeibacter rhaeticus]